MSNPAPTPPPKTPANSNISPDTPQPSLNISAIKAAANPTPTPDSTKSITPTQTEQALADYHKAFEEEFTKSTSLSSKAIQQVQEIFTQNAPDIAQRLVAMAISSKSDSVRFNVSRYIIDTVRESDETLSLDPFQQLIDSLTPQTVPDPNS